MTLNNKIIRIIEDGFKGINTQLQQNRQIRVHTATKLISFQKTVNNFNNYLHQDFISIAEISNSSLSADEKLPSCLKIQRNIKNIKISLITYISLWNINIQQRIINPQAAKRSIGNLLTNESQLLGTTINKLLSNREFHYLDALNCKQLFSKCGSIYSEKR